MPDQLNEHYKYANQQELTTLIEQKYAIRPPNASSFVRMLERFVSRDALFPTNIVSSIYYDTPSLESYRESNHGFYSRTKIRLRWYNQADEVNRGRIVRCYLEVKRVAGQVRTKKRLEVEVAGNMLDSNPLASTEVLRLGQLASGLMPGIPRQLIPSILVRYHRDRFFDPVSRSRMAVDQDITCCALNGAFLPGRPLDFPMSILEIKGDSNRLPRAIVPLSNYLEGNGLSGKYVYFCRQLLHSPVGVVSRG